MFEKIKKYGLPIFIFLLFFTVIFIFYLDWQTSHRQLTFAVLDIGQGDALFIESSSGTQVLVDVGPPRKIIGELSRLMSPLDRYIDAVIITNPDQDHIGGFTDVLEIYKIGKIFESGTINNSKTYQNLETEIKNQNIPRILAQKGMKLHLGDGAVIDILFPDRDVSDWTPNDGSIIARLTYGATSIMLTGDSTIKTEKIILTNNPSGNLASDILKVGHHGSRTSTSDSFLKAVSPKYALISNGKNNKYGHPHQEIVDTLEQFGAKILRTDLLGTIVFFCDRINPCEIKK
jgi:competence protein ComEC